MVRLQGRRVIIRPLTLEDVEPVFLGRTKLAEQGILASMPDRDGLRARLPHWDTLRDRRVNLGIEVDGCLIGEIQSFRPKTHRAGYTEAYEVGVSIYATSDRGQGHGTEALRLFVDWLITNGAQQVLGGTAPANEAMRRVFERSGFIRQDQAGEQGLEDLTYGLPPIKE